MVHPSLLPIPLCMTTQPKMVLNLVSARERRYVCVCVGGGGGVMLCPLRHTSIDGYSTERNNLGYLIATVLDNISQ